MTFATAQALEARFGSAELLQLSDRENVGAMDEAVVDAALQDADAEIIGLLAGSVMIDAQDPPLNLVRLACDIARYRLYGAVAPEDVRKRYEDATAFLKRVAEGKATLDGGASAPTAPQASPRPAATDPGERVWKRGIS